MNNHLNFEVHQTHMTDLRREADKERLVQEALAGQPTNSVVSTAMVALGRRFVKLGQHLQAQYEPQGEIAFSAD
jgi:hypothetical protein